MTGEGKITGGNSLCKGPKKGLLRNYTRTNKLGQREHGVEGQGRVKLENESGWRISQVEKRIPG